MKTKYIHHKKNRNSIKKKKPTKHTVVGTVTVVATSSSGSHHNSITHVSQDGRVDDLAWVYNNEVRNYPRVLSNVPNYFTQDATHSYSVTGNNKGLQMLGTYAGATLLDKVISARYALSGIKYGNTTTTRSGVTMVPLPDSPPAENCEWDETITSTMNYEWHF
jgi:hypothetical protein